MAEQSLEAVTNAAENLFAGATDAERMLSAVEGMRKLFDGSKACFVHVGASDHDHEVFATDPDSSLEQRYFGDLAGDFMDMAELLRARVPAGTVYRDHDILGTKALRASRAWQEWMRPQDMYGSLSCRVAEAGSVYAFFDVQRGHNQEPFSAADAELLQRLQPVLHRVAEVRRHIGRLQGQLDLAHRALDTIAVGIVVLDAEMTMVYANEEADEILSSAAGALGLRQGRVVAGQQSEQRGLRRLIDDTLRGKADELDARPRTSMILRGDGTRPLSACVMPARRGDAIGDRRRQVMIALRPLQTASSLSCGLRQLFDLTDTEAKFACALADGMSLAEAAEMQGVRISTARTHLARIFQKTGTRQQSQLVSLLRSAMLPLRQG